MPSLRDQLAAAAREVPERRWATPSDIAVRGRRRTRRQRAAVVGATFLVVAAVVLAATGGLVPHRAAPSTPPVLTCLVADGTPGPAALPGRVLLGGRQIVVVDLATGRSVPAGDCGAVGSTERAVPVTHAQVTMGGPMDAVSIVDASGQRTTIGTDHSLTEAYPTPDGGFLVVRDNYPTTPDATLLRYDSNGSQVSGPTKVPESVVFAVEGVVDTGIAAGGNTDLYIVDPATGAVLRVLDRFTTWGVAASGHLIAWLPHYDKETVEFTADKQIPLRCTPSCQPIAIYDTRTGTTREYPSTTPDGRLYTSAAFSPDGTRLALATADDPASHDGSTVAVLDLASGATTLMPGIPSQGQPGGPSLTWLPGGASLIVAGTTQTGAQLLVWHPGDSTLRPAVTLTGDATSATVSALGQDDTAWTQP